MTVINKQDADLLFNAARTHSAWLEKEVPEELLKKAYALAKMGPTSANCQPLRILFIKSKEAKERLKPLLDKGNVEKTMSAPVTAVIAHDLEFYEHLDRFFPHAPGMKKYFEGNDEKIKSTAFRNGSLQGAYFIIAARALGLDCGPMSGFDNARLDEEFFKNTKWKSNFLINLGYGDAAKLHPRSPRPEFDEFCKIV
jgi:3-hydroxypropanoate dehydrogenase